jgi:hypothetical protein
LPGDQPASGCGNVGWLKNTGACVQNTGWRVWCDGFYQGETSSIQAVERLWQKRFRPELASTRSVLPGALFAVNLAGQVIRRASLGLVGIDFTEEAEMACLRVVLQGEFVAQDTTAARFIADGLNLNMCQLPGRFVE